MTCAALFRPVNLYPVYAVLQHKNKVHSALERQIHLTEKFYGTNVTLKSMIEIFSLTNHYISHQETMLKAGDSIKPWDRHI